MYQILVLICGGIVGATTTFLLQRYGFNAVVASCIIGLIGALVGYLLKIPELSIIIFTGSFVGMTGKLIAPTNNLMATIPLIVFGGALSGIIYYFSPNILIGFGGRLGTIAFISIIISFYTFLIIKKLI